MTRRNKGALLLEALIGLAIFATALLLAYGAFPNSQRAAAQARHYLYASAMAREYLDLELQKSYDLVINSVPSYQVRPVIVNGQTVNLSFEMEVETGPEVVGPPTDRKNVRCSVRWDEGPFRREVSYEAWISRVTP